MAEDQLHYHFKIIGQVQGVWFRKYAHAKANDLGLKGYVRNLDDGSVEIEAEGHARMVKALRSWCFEGSPLADVKDVQCKKGDVKGYESFDIRR